jgi:hypothetical protein
MCLYCIPEAAPPADDRALHDESLFPHGRVGYYGTTTDDVQAALDACPFCNPAIS